MRRQMINAVLLAGFLCASGFSQMVELFGPGRFVHLQSSYNVFGWNTALSVNLQGVRMSLTESRMLERWAPRCITDKSILLDFVARSRDGHEVPVWHLPDSQAFFFVSGMTIDADGAPNAYSPDDTGLDELANAGSPAHWNGIITDHNGNPLIQQEGDPFPGYYVSCTSLSDTTRTFADPARYVDASTIPYVVLPEDVARRGGARLGDFAAVLNLRNGKSSFAIYADVGTLGEGSMALADALGIWSDARQGGASDGILYLLFPGSGNLRPRTMVEIQSEGEKLFCNWSQKEKLMFRP